jgi:alanine dehydrogenase
MSNIFTSILLDFAELGGLKNAIWKNPGIRSSIYLYQGNLTNVDMASRFNMTAKDLDLLVVSSL